MDYGTAQLIFLIILLVGMATVVIGTFVFTSLVDRSLANEGARSPSREDRQNEEQTSAESDTNKGTDEDRPEEKS